MIGWDHKQKLGELTILQFIAERVPKISQHIFTIYQKQQESSCNLFRLYCSYADPGAFGI